MKDGRGDQLGLFDSPLESAFRQYHDRHPEVWRYLVRLVGQLQRRGRDRYGIAALWERLRWHFSIERGEEEFKLNNNHKAYYARLLMARYPQYAGFFQTRQLAGENRKNHDESQEI